MAKYRNDGGGPVTERPAKKRHQRAAAADNSRRTTSIMDRQSAGTDVWSQSGRPAGMTTWTAIAAIATRRWPSSGQNGSADWSCRSRQHRVGLANVLFLF